MAHGDRETVVCMRKLWAVLEFGLIYPLNALIRMLSIITAGLWSFIWPRKYLKGYSAVSRVADMGRSGRVSLHGRGSISIDLLRVRLHTPDGLMECRIEQAPHYKWIKGLILGRENESDRLEYRKYIEDYEDGIDVDVRLEEVRSLVIEISDLLINNPSKISVIVTPLVFSLKHEISFMVIDGVHRTSIAKACGLREIQVLF